MKRRQSRRPNGRFQRNTLKNTFGLQAWVCAACRSFNPREAEDPKPERCDSCGEPFVDAGEGE